MLFVKIKEYIQSESIKAEYLLLFHETTDTDVQKPCS